MDTRSLPAWYARHGRHDLPWRLTRDRWAVFVSEVMLQQTPVSRVLTRWDRFMTRWPDPASCAASSLDDILREWQGLGYPRRARALHETAGIVATTGWPEDEAGLRALPGIGEYTGRALLWLTGDATSPPPRDINLTRVAARSGSGKEAWEVPPRDLDGVVATALPPRMQARDYILALFDVGALHCKAIPVCAGCPLARGCASRDRLAAAPPPPSPRRQAAYHGSDRQLRGALLRAVLEARPGIELTEIDTMAVPAAARPGAIEAALRGLAADGLIPGHLAPADRQAPRRGTIPPHG